MDCAMGGSLKRKRPYQQRCRDGFLIDDDADERRSNRSWNSGSRRSLVANDDCCNGHADVNGLDAAVDPEMVDNVESSV